MRAWSDIADASDTGYRSEQRGDSDMAYSDYGGYAYRNGERVVMRSDAVLSPDGIQATPGQWPGWTLEAGRNGGCYHALLGDGPVFVSLYKQSSLGLHRLGDEVSLEGACVTPSAKFEDFEWQGKQYRTLDREAFKKSEEPCSFEIDGHRVTVYWREEDN